MIIGVNHANDFVEAFQFLLGSIKLNEALRS